MLPDLAKWLDRFRLEARRIRIVGRNHQLYFNRHHELISLNQPRLLDTPTEYSHVNEIGQARSA